MTGTLTTAAVEACQSYEALMFGAVLQLTLGTVVTVLAFTVICWWWVRQNTPPKPSKTKRQRR